MLTLQKILCPLMTDQGSEKTSMCDDFAWPIRQLFPKNYQCYAGKECLIRNGSADESMKCDQREVCALGDNCPGPAGHQCEPVGATQSSKQVQKEAQVAV